MKAKVISVAEGAWKDGKPNWAVSVAQEGKEPIKLYASTQEIGEGLAIGLGREYNFTLKTTGKEGQPLKYPYITEAVPIKVLQLGGPSDADHAGPWPGTPVDTPTPPAKTPTAVPKLTKQPAAPPPTGNGQPSFTDRRELGIAWSVALQQATVAITSKAVSLDEEGVTRTASDAILNLARKYFAEGQKVLNKWMEE